MNKKKRTSRIVWSIGLLLAVLVLLIAPAGAEWVERVDLLVSFIAVGVVGSLALKYYVRRDDERDE
jgi:hypothetical protein